MPKAELLDAAPTWVDAGCGTSVGWPPQAAMTDAARSARNVTVSPWDDLMNKPSPKIQPETLSASDDQEHRQQHISTVLVPRLCSKEAYSPFQARVLL
jgi:hypothetical protein